MRTPRSLGLPCIALAAALSAACGEADHPRPDPEEHGVEQPAPDAGAPWVDAGPDVAAPAIGAPVACGASLPGTPLRGDLAEAQQGYADALDALDLTALPDPVDFSGETALLQGFVRFMLGRSGTSVSRAEALSAGGLGKAVLAAAAKGEGRGIDLVFLRQGLYYHYLCSRPLPRDLDELKSRYGDYATWPKREIACSAPKDGPRTLYENRDSGVYVAETVVAGGIRETEVLFADQRADGQLDFAVYTPEGELTDRSSFATPGGGTMTSAAPYTCMGCHVHTQTETFSLVTPLSGTGAGCKQ